MVHIYSYIEKAIEKIYEKKQIKTSDKKRPTYRSSSGGGFESFVITAVVKYIPHRRYTRVPTRHDNMADKNHPCVRKFLKIHLYTLHE